MSSIFKSFETTKSTKDTKGKALFRVVGAFRGQFFNLSCHLELSV